MFNSFIAVLMAVATMLAGLGSSAPVAQPVDHHYANQTPYGDPATSKVLTPPKGYALTFIETIGRHGARTLTSSSRERRALLVWQAAERRDALTDIGKSFGDDVASFAKTEQKIGYGNLSGVGRTEWNGIGRRTADNYRAYLEQAMAKGDSVVFKTSPIQRTIDSATAMRETLEQGIPGLRVKPFITDPATLLLSNGATIEGNRAVAAVLAKPEVVAAAKDLLGRMYDPSYVATIGDPVQAALDIYLLYCTAPGLADETDVTFARYVPIADAKALSYAVDAGNFYQYGPGVAGQDSSYAQARPLLKDFFTELDQRLAGGKTAAVFRLAHGETTMPFEALTRMPGSGVQAPVGTPYSYDDNPWRGDVAGKLAGNVEWTAFRSRSGKVLVTVRYNERPVRLDPGCRSTTPYFYRPEELKRCLG